MTGSSAASIPLLIKCWQDEEMGNVDVLGSDILPPEVNHQNRDLDLYPCQSVMVGRQEFACGLC